MVVLPQSRRNRTPTPLLLPAGMGLQMLVRFCPVTSYTDVCLANDLSHECLALTWCCSTATAQQLCFPRSSTIYEFYALFQITLTIQELRGNQENFLFYFIFYLFSFIFYGKSLFPACSCLLLSSPKQIAVAPLV